jgi:hypothetical protein
MKYTLSVERPGIGEQIQAENDCPNLAAALAWAGSLLRVGGDDATHFMRSADGCVNAKYVRTVGGKWYAIALPASPTGHDRA